MFGIGIQEIVIIGLIGILIFGPIIVVAVIVLVLMAKGRRDQ
jgi:hypothetical protein